jgi:hypothetical protein
MEWGTGPEEAKALVRMLKENTRQSRAYIEGRRSRGVTSEMARAWAKAYQDFANYELRNKTAPWRAELLRRIAELL